MDKKDRDYLESLVRDYGLDEVVEEMYRICRQYAKQERASLHGDLYADAWDHNAAKLRTACSELRGVFAPEKGD